jgi:hypothetical protein
MYATVPTALRRGTNVHLMHSQATRTGIAEQETAVKRMNKKDPYEIDEDMAR